MSEINFEEDKFIGFNRKRLDELQDSYEFQFLKHPKIIKLEKAFNEFKRAWETEFGVEMNHKYILCNQDESYAQKVLDVILEGETEKKEKDKCWSCGGNWPKDEEACRDCGEILTF